MEGEVTNRDDVVAIELPAPEGWKKRFTPKKSGTPKRNEITFISPTGEEIKTKKQLDQYIKSHPECPSASEFDWGTGDTPRRSARLSEKPKAEETPDSETPKKKQKRSSSKKESKGKKQEEKENVDGDIQATEETKTVEGPSEETNEDTQVADVDKVVVTDEIPPAEEDKDTEEKVVDEKIIEKEENVAKNDAMEEDNTENKSVAVEENNEETKKESVDVGPALADKEAVTVEDYAVAATAGIGGEDQNKGEKIENAEAVPHQPAGGDYQSGTYELKTSQVSC